MSDTPIRREPPPKLDRDPAAHERRCKIVDGACLSLGMWLPIIHSKACHHGVTRHRSQYIGSVRSVAVLRMNCVAALASYALGQQTTDK